MNHEEITQKIKNKQPYTLNISDGMTERMVQNAKEQISRLLATREEAYPVFLAKREAVDDAQRAFNESKAFMDTVDEEIRQQELIVDALVNFKSKDDPGKRLRLHGEPAEESAGGEKVPRARAKSDVRISWQHEAAEVLKETGKFMQAEEIFDTIVKRSHIQEALKKMKSAKAMNTVKTLTVDNLTSHAVKVSMKNWNARFKPQFTVVKEMIGLVDWVDEDNNPKDDHKAQFATKRIAPPRPQQPQPDGAAAS